MLGSSAMLPLEATLLEKLGKTEALHAGAKTNGELEAARRARSASGLVLRSLAGGAGRGAALPGAGRFSRRPAYASRCCAHSSRCTARSSRRTAGRHDADKGLRDAGGRSPIVWPGAAARKRRLSSCRGARRARTSLAHSASQALARLRDELSLAA